MENPVCVVKKLCCVYTVQRSTQQGNTQQHTRTIITIIITIIHIIIHNDYNTIQSCNTNYQSTPHHISCPTTHIPPCVLPALVNDDPLLVITTDTSLVFRGCSDRGATYTTGGKGKPCWGGRRSLVIHAGLRGGGRCGGGVEVVCRWCAGGVGGVRRAHQWFVL